MTEECTLEIGPDGHARLAGVLTFDTAARLHRVMQERLPAGTSLQSVDLSDIGNVDSAGLALLLEWQAEHGPANESITVTGAPDNLLHLARLCSADSLLTLSGRAAE